MPCKQSTQETSGCPRELVVIVAQPSIFFFYIHCSSLFSSFIAIPLALQTNKDIDELNLAYWEKKNNNNGDKEKVI